MNPTTSFGDLAAWLRAGASGAYGEEAAVGLLIAHRTWLLRADFTTTAIEIADDEAMAFIDWQKATTLLDAGAFACSGSEAAVLTVAASLTGRAPINLTALTSLDSSNLTAVLVALAHAGGHRYTEVRLG
jgi:hypothetical protein